MVPTGGEFQYEFELYTPDEQNKLVREAALELALTGSFGDFIERVTTEEMWEKRSALAFLRAKDKEIERLAARLSREFDS